VLLIINHTYNVIESRGCNDLSQEQDSQTRRVVKQGHADVNKPEGVSATEVETMPGCDLFKSLISN